MNDRKTKRDKFRSWMLTAEIDECKGNEPVVPLSEINLLQDVKVIIVLATYVFFLFGLCRRISERVDDL